MKNLLVSLALALFIPISSLAVSLDELQSTPNRYIKMAEDVQSTSYLDIDSITSIRYSPPYYTLQADEYIIRFTHDVIIQTTSVYNYDYNRSFHSLMVKAFKDYPTYTKAQILNLLIAQMQDDTGILYSITKANLYNFDGQFVASRDTNLKNKKVLFSTNSHHVANFIFKKYYDLEFVPGF